MVRLSPREKRVILQLCEAQSNKEIGRRLNLTEGSVKTYLSGIFAKLGLKNRVALAQWAWQRDLEAIPTTHEGEEDRC